MVMVIEQGTRSYLIMARNQVVSYNGGYRIVSVLIHGHQLISRSLFLYNCYPSDRLYNTLNYIIDSYSTLYFTQAVVNDN
jgi:hypothetical protein